MIFLSDFPQVITMVPYFYHSFLFTAAFKKSDAMVVERVKKQYKGNRWYESDEEASIRMLTYGYPLIEH